MNRHSSIRLAVDGGGSILLHPWTGTSSLPSPTVRVSALSQGCIMLTSDRFLLGRGEQTDMVRDRRNSSAMKLLEEARQVPPNSLPWGQVLYSSLESTFPASAKGKKVNCASHACPEALLFSGTTYKQQAACLSLPPSFAPLPLSSCLPPID